MLKGIQENQPDSATALPAVLLSQFEVTGGTPWFSNNWCKGTYVLCKFTHSV